VAEKFSPPIFNDIWDPLRFVSNQNKLMSHFSFKPEIYENPFCHHPSSDGHQSLRQSLGAIFGDLVLWWHFLILFFLKVD
jgi:hypothetical protein